ncbi:MAG: prepilin peptidase [Pirellulaceae bacterium]|nr:MAG: prepilin peptidase [Pirellulaceae bacterium]
MVEAFIQLPEAWRAAIVGLLSLIVARGINWAIYNWAYHRRAIGPWVPPQSGARRWSEHLPVVGWWLLRREYAAFSVWTWLRPLSLELLLPVFLTYYYLAYTHGISLPPGVVLDPFMQALHWQFVAHYVLFSLMTVATFIDFDEQSIPDYVTIPGTCIALAGALFAPSWYPMDAFGTIQELHACSPRRWDPQLDTVVGLRWGLIIIAVWFFALLDRRWIGRQGIQRAIVYFLARILRSRTVLFSVAIGAAIMLALTLYGWLAARPGRWTFLLSGLFGLAFAGGVTWAVRITASVGLGVEALGFGDVTLMAMIGAFLGWQPSLLIFFLAPLVAIVFVIVRWLLTGETATPYGPYLCAATALLLLFWNALWTAWAAAVFASLGTVVIAIVIGCVALMGVLLWIWRLVKETLLH